MAQRRTSAARQYPTDIAPTAPGKDAVETLKRLFESGQFGDAENLAQELLKTFPKVLSLYDFLSTAQVKLAKLDDAARTCRKALKQNPKYANAHANLGNILNRLGRTKAAVTSCRKALRAEPTHQEASINLGIALNADGKPEEAAAVLKRALEFHPESAKLHSNLGNTLKQSGRLSEALASHQEAVRLNPRIGAIHNNLGSTLFALGRHDDAADSYLQAVRLDPQNAESLSNLAKVLVNLNKTDEALAIYEQALTINPNLVSALNGIGGILERRNDTENAVAFAERAMSIAPEDPGNILLWSILLRRMKRLDEATQLLEPLAGLVLPDEQLSVVHNELGKQFDLRRDSEKAFAHFSASNDIQSRGATAQAIDRSAFLAQVEAMDSTLTPEWLASWPASDDPIGHDTPAFLVGFPRSGTTLLDQIMDSHPGIQVIEEKPSFTEVIARINDKATGYPNAIAHLEAHELPVLREIYFRSVAQYVERESGTLLVDKLPLHIRHVALIQRLFPGAPVILALRHPCDVVLSNFMQHFEVNEAMANFFTLEDAAKCYAQVMKLWQKSASLIELNSHTLKYEALLDDFDGEVGKLLEFLGVGWDDTVREFDRHARERGAINTPSYQAVSEPINTVARYRWRRYEKQLAPVMDILGPFIEAFGYG